MFDKANKNYYYFYTGTTPLRETKYFSINIVFKCDTNIAKCRLS